MEKVTKAVKLESIESLRSTIGKAEKAYAQMTRNGANTTMIGKRLQALRIGLAVLEDVWHQRSHQYTPKDLVEARQVLTGLFPSVQRIYAKSKPGSPQKTLLQRRIKALELAVQAIDDLSSDSVPNKWGL